MTTTGPTANRVMDIRYSLLRDCNVCKLISPHTSPLVPPSRTHVQMMYLKSGLIKCHCGSCDGVVSRAEHNTKILSVDLNPLIQTNVRFVSVSRTRRSSRRHTNLHTCTTKLCTSLCSNQTVFYLGLFDFHTHTQIHQCQCQVTPPNRECVRPNANCHPLVRAYEFPLFACVD